MVFTRDSLNLAIALVCALSVCAVSKVAFPEPIESRQPDGSSVVIRKVGNEWSHYVVNEDGALLAKDSSGFWNYADGMGKPTGVKAHARGNRSTEEMQFLDKRDSKGLLENFKNLHRSKVLTDTSLVRHATASSAVLRAPSLAASGTSLAANIESLATRPSYSVSLATGEVRGIVLLVEFSDVKFSSEDPQAEYTNYMNQQGYSNYMMTGSVRDYFIENSDSAYTPIFDVMQPVTLKNTRDSYGAEAYSDDNIAEGTYYALDEALDSLIARGVDFSPYDNDGDKYLDFIYMIYAGVGSADTDVSSAIWPHSSYYKKRLKRNPSLYSGLYACSNEISGGAYTIDKNTSMLDGIGTIAHEFSHVLGLLDTYDVFYDSVGRATPYVWDLMDLGEYLCVSNSYNLRGCSPPRLNAFERYSLGWLTPRTIATDEDSVAIAKIEKNDGVLVPTDNPDEYFMLEFRTQEGFDSALPYHGMLIWHIYYNEDWWDHNYVNANDTLGVELIRADDSASYSSYYSYHDDTKLKGDPFPGRKGITEFAGFKTYSGDSLELALYDIAEEDSVVTFKVRRGASLESSSSTLQESSSDAVAESSSSVLPDSSEDVSSSSAVLPESSSELELSSAEVAESSSSEVLPESSSQLNEEPARLDVFAESKIRMNVNRFGILVQVPKEFGLGTHKLIRLFDMNGIQIYAESFEGNFLAINGNQFRNRTLIAVFQIDGKIVRKMKVAF